MVASLTRGLSVESIADTGRARASYRTDLVTAVLGAWFVVGLFLDAWAHNNLAELETFFTAWHGVFYSGFVATSAWMCWSVLQSLLAGRRGLAAVPVGYGLALAAIPVFAAAGLADLVWHTVFGIETSLDILFSPTHLVLAGSMALIVTSPLRSAWGAPSGVAGPGLRRLLPAVLSLGFATALVLLFVQYANALVWSPEGVVLALSRQGDDVLLLDGPRARDLVGSVAVTNVVLLFPLLLLARRWAVPPGAATVGLLAVAGLVGAVTAFESPAMLLGLVLSGLCVDGLVAWLRPGAGGRWRVVAFAGLSSFVVWGLFVAVTSAAVGRLPAVVELWTGLPVVAGLHGVLLGVLAAPVWPERGAAPAPVVVAEPVGRSDHPTT
jgi:hypothetical protein